MIQEQLVMQCNVKEMYQALLLDFKAQYRVVKNEELADDAIHKGFSFSKELPKQKDSHEINIATYKIIDCKENEKFVMEYVSKTYHKVISAQISPIDETHTQLYFGTFEEKLAQNKPSKDFGEDCVVKAKLKTKIALHKMLKNAKKQAQ